MRKSENSVIPCSADIDLNGIPTVGNLMEINRTSKTRKLRGNLTERIALLYNLYVYLWQVAAEPEVPFHLTIDAAAPMQGYKLTFNWKE